MEILHVDIFAFLRALRAQGAKYISERKKKSVQSFRENESKFYIKKLT